jgi:hypothetical protein
MVAVCGAQAHDVAAQTSPDAGTTGSAATGSGVTAPADVQTPGNPPALTEEQETKSTATPEETPAEAGYARGFFGLDYYAGRSNLAGQRRFSDGFWIGSGPAYPANAYLRWETGNGAEAKFSYGTGSLYRGPNSVVTQPNEAWYQTPLGNTKSNTKVTLGKFYVPFALQEWQYESKWGGMVQTSWGKTDLSASLNADRLTDNPNLYTRLGHNLSENINVGVSLGLGRGISFGTPQNKAFGVDLTANWRKFSLISEYVDIRRRAADRFSFGFAKLSYEAGKWRPFVSRHSWNDRSGNYGSFRSSTAGVDFQVSPQVVLQAAVSHNPGQNVKWLQIHWTPEWKYYDEREAKGPRR